LAQKIILIFKVFIYFLLVYSGSFKWLPLPFDLTVLTAGLCSIILIFSVKKKLLVTTEIKQYFTIFFLICTAFLLSNFYSISTVYANSKSLSFIINILTFVYPIIVFDRISVIKVIKPIFLIVGVFIFIGLTYMYVNNLFEVFFHDAYMEEMTDLKIPSYLTIGIFLSTIVLICISKGLKLVPLIYILISVFFLFNLGGRGPIFNLLICTVAFLILTLGSKRIFTFKNVMILVVAFFMIVVFFDFKSLFISSEFFTFERFNPFDMSKSDPSTLRRIYLLQTGWESITNHPLLGLGIGSSGLILTGEDVTEFPHNLIIESMMEIGVIGGVLVVFFYAKFFITERKYLKNPELILLYVIALLYFLEDLKSGSFDAWRISLFWISIYLSEKRFYGRKQYS